MGHAQPPKGRRQERAPALAGMVQAAVRMVEQGNWSHAETLARQALREAPGHPGAVAVLGILAVEREDLQTGLVHLKEALAAGHRSAAAYRYLGYALSRLGEVEGALDACRRGLEMDPRDPALANNMASALMSKARWEEARGWALRALELQPESAHARFNLGLLDLQKEDFEAGWEGYEARWELPGHRRPSLGRGLWGGTPLPGKHLLVYPDQRVEDTLMFARFLRPVADLGLAVHLVVQPELKDLFHPWSFLASLRAAEESLPEFDVHASLASLPRLLKVRRETPVWKGPYFSVPLLVPHRAELDRRLEVEGRRIGLLWRDPFAQGPDPFRSLPPEGARHLDPGAAGTLFTFSPLGSAQNTVDLQDCLGGLADLAHALSRLDLLVSVDAPAAHLAGAMGIPTLLLLHQNSDWRWGLGREDSPWYPGHRLLRQARYGDWNGPLAAAGSLLRE
ncbi:MAG: glycosyltransferase family protein [Acidobacteria bacterium]|nr:glycosyltransferase family protein [Acidobacteriota bacterium]